MVEFKPELNLIGLSTETKPTENVKNGSTFLAVDTAETYVFYDGIWYNQDTPEVVNETEEEET